MMARLWVDDDDERAADAKIKRAEWRRDGLDDDDPDEADRIADREERQREDRGP